MDSVGLIEIRDLIYRRSSLIPLKLSKVKSIIKLSSDYSGDQIITEIIERALGVFERSKPYKGRFKYYLTPEDTGDIILYNNFNGYLSGSLDETQINLIPSAIFGISFSENNSHATLFRRFRYDAPVIYNSGLGTEVAFILGIYKRPVITEYDAGGDYLPTSKIYYLNKYDSSWDRFIDQCLFEFLSYILRITRNITLPNLPVELFQAVETEVGRLDTELKEYYNTQGNGDYIE